MDKNDTYLCIKIGNSTKMYQTCETKKWRTIHLKTFQHVLFLQPHHQVQTVSSATPLNKFPKMHPQKLNYIFHYPQSKQLRSTAKAHQFSPSLRPATASMGFASHARLHILRSRKCETSGGCCAEKEGIRGFPRLGVLAPPRGPISIIKQTLIAKSLYSSDGAGCPPYVLSLRDSACPTSVLSKQS